MAEVTAKGNVCGKCFPARYVLAVLGSIAMGITYALKVNLSIAMVGMLNHTALTAAHLEHPQPGIISNITNQVHSECITADEANNSAAQTLEDGPFDWSESLQGSVLSSYFWGYIVAQVPGARVAELFSAKWVMLVSVAVNILCTLLTPPFAKLHFTAMILMRIIEGLCGGVTFPAMHVLLANWAPPNERSVMSSVVYAGTSLGTVISILSAGVLAATVGWEAVFYVMGGVCALWCVLWLWLVQDTPSKQPFITADEREFINNSLGERGGDGSVKKSQERVVPWRCVFTSKPFWAILVAHLCSNWGWYMILIELPFYMKQVLHFNIKENAVLTAIPFLAMWIFSMLISKLLDFLRARNTITTTAARKIATITASAFPAVILIALCYIGCVRWLAVLLMTIAVMTKGGMFCGFLSNHIDIAPNFAGTLVAITNTAATVPGIIVPLFVGYLTHGNQTIGAWRVIFFVTVALYTLEVIVYGLFGSGEEQPWNRSPEQKRCEEQPLHQTNAAYKATEH